MRLQRARDTIPGGTFLMGSDKHYADEAPVHRVTVNALWIDRTPVTNRQFREFSAETCSANNTVVSGALHAPARGRQPVGAFHDGRSEAASSGWLRSRRQRPANLQVAGEQGV